LYHKSLAIQRNIQTRNQIIQPSFSIFSSQTINPSSQTFSFISDALSFNFPAFSSASLTISESHNFFHNFSASFPASIASFFPASRALFSFSGE